MARCKIKECNRIAVYGELCAAHKVLSNANKKTNESKFIKYPWQKLYYTNSWKKLRAMHLSSHPLCVKCDFPGNEVDHVIDHKGDRELFFDADNLQTLCKSCHASKTFSDYEFDSLPRKNEQLFIFNLVSPDRCDMLKMSKATGINIHTDYIYKLLSKQSESTFNLSKKEYIINLYKLVSKQLKYKPQVNSNSDEILKLLMKE